MGYLAAKGFGAIIHFSVHPDLGNSNRYAAYIEVANLGLPEREFYLEDNEKAEQIRKKYMDYIAQLLPVSYTHLTLCACYYSGMLWRNGFRYESGIELSDVANDEW